MSQIIGRTTSRVRNDKPRAVQWHVDRIRTELDTIHEAVAVLRPLWGTSTRTLTERHASAVAVIYRCYASMLKSVAAHIVRSGTDAEDVVHDVFCKLPWVVGQYRSGGLGGWLKQVTVTTALMHLRKARHRREEELFDEYRYWAAVTEEVGIVHSDYADELHGALRQLSDSLRRVVLLRFYLGYSHQEIGAALGISPNASEVRLCRAIKQLRQALPGAGGAAGSTGAGDESLTVARAS